MNTKEDSILTGIVEPEITTSNFFIRCFEESNLLFSLQIRLTQMFPISQQIPSLLDMLLSMQKQMGVKIHGLPR